MAKKKSQNKTIESFDNANCDLKPANKNEMTGLVANCDRFKNLKHSSVAPYELQKVHNYY